MRVDNPLGTRVLVSADAGESFDELFRASARLPGFALAKDGSALALGGPSDGVWVGALDGSALEQRSTVGPSCLTYGPDGLYACSDAGDVGTLLLRSSDGGRSFETLVRFESLCGTTACDGSTEVARTCGADWQSLAPTLGTTCGTTPVVKPPADVPSRLRASGGGCAPRVGANGVSGWLNWAVLAALLGDAWRARAHRRNSPRVGG